MATHSSGSASAEEINTLERAQVAIVHYWFVSRGGGEKVVEALAEIFPNADIFALVVNPDELPPLLQSRRIHTSFLQKVPGARKFHRHFLLLHPTALEQFDLSGYDLVISSESGPAKGVITSAKTCHVCYCHSPMRYLWDMHSEYRANMNPLVRAIYSCASTWLRVWDLATAARVDSFVANSQFVASRIRKFYHRESTVIYPPVETGVATVQRQPGDYYLCVGRLVNYKRVDLAVQACSRINRRLKVVGDGPEMKRLRKMAGPTIEFSKFESSEKLGESFAGCRALLFPGEEDFGIVPVEAQSFGRPVIAYGSGGSLETVIGCWPDEPLESSHTGLFFGEQTVESLEEAILRFESLEARFSPDVIATRAQQFDSGRFKLEMQRYLARIYGEFQENLMSRRRERQMA
ncbi:MAG TPA: glycosyltransferase [Acidobacteriaceae bacterium]|nr:glycosyltransferase [Acidobacteriaceae bacterium]